MNHRNPAPPKRIWKDDSLEIPMTNGVKVFCPSTVSSMPSNPTRLGSPQPVRSARLFSTGPRQAQARRSSKQSARLSSERQLADGRRRQLIQPGPGIPRHQCMEASKHQEAHE